MSCDYWMHLHYSHHWSQQKTRYSDSLAFHSFDYNHSRDFYQSFSVPDAPEAIACL
jgi:hypothetical protein